MSVVPGCGHQGCIVSFGSIRLQGGLAPAPVLRGGSVHGSPGAAVVRAPDVTGSPGRSVTLPGPYNVSNQVRAGCPPFSSLSRRNSFFLTRSALAPILWLDLYVFTAVGLCCESQQRCDENVAVA